MKIPTEAAAREEFYLDIAQKDEQITQHKELIIYLAQVQKNHQRTSIRFILI